jgi:hypothetical protein
MERLTTHEWHTSARVDLVYRLERPRRHATLAHVLRRLWRHDVWLLLNHLSKTA